MIEMLSGLFVGFLLGGTLGYALGENSVLRADRKNKHDDADHPDG